MRPLTITREMQIDFYLFNVGVQRARDDYEAQSIGSACPHGIGDTTCPPCRTRARRLLLVATSEDECADLLAIIDRPSASAARCGTDGGYNAHRRRGESACRACRAAHTDCQRERRGRA